MLGFDFYNKNTIPAWHITGYDITYYKVWKKCCSHLKIYTKGDAGRGAGGGVKKLGENSVAHQVNLCTFNEH